MARPVSDTATEHAERVLFTTIVEDASLSAGDAPLESALARHLATAAEGYGDLLGPLVVPVARLGELAATKRSHPVTVVVDATAAAGVDEARAALDGLATDRTVTVAGVDIAWWEGWHTAAGWDEPVSVLVPFDHNLATALEDVADHTGAASALQAILPVGGLTVTELAAGVRHSVDLDLGFKVTGGTPSALTADGAGGAADVGFLNVIAASRYALAHAAEVPELVDLLGQTDPDATVAILTRMSEGDGSVVRAFFTSYATDDVSGALAQVAALGLLGDEI